MEQIKISFLTSFGTTFQSKCYDVLTFLKENFAHENLNKTASKVANNRPKCSYFQ